MIKERSSISRTPSSASKKNKKSSSIVNAIKSDDQVQEPTPLVKQSPVVKKVMTSSKRKRTLSETSDGTRVEDPATVLDSPKAKTDVMPTASKRSRMADKESQPQESFLPMIQQRLADLNARSAYVRKLPRNTTLGQVKKLFPTSINARLQSSKHVNRRKHAFIEFKSEAAAKAAVQAANGKLIADIPIHVELCSTRSSSTGNTTTTNTSTEPLHWRNPSQRKLNEFSKCCLHVCCVPKITPPEEIRQLFPRASLFQFNTDGVSKGTSNCRVNFANYEDAVEAFKTQHGVVVQGSPIIVNFAFKKHPVSKNKKKAAVAALKGKLTQQQQHMTPRAPEPKQLPSSGTPRRTPGSHTKSSVMMDVSEPLITPTHVTPLGLKSKEQHTKKKNKTPTPKGKQTTTVHTPSPVVKTPKAKTPNKVGKSPSVKTPKSAKMKSPKLH